MESGRLSVNGCIRTHPEESTCIQPPLPGWPSNTQTNCKIKEEKKVKDLTVKPIRLKQEEPKLSIKKLVAGSIQDTDKLKPLETQVAGHGTGDKISHRGMLHHENGFVLKPAQAPPKGTREIEFYETISRSSNPIDAKLYSFMPKFYGTEKISIDGLPHSHYLVLEDLTEGMIAPCVMDIKIGAKTYGPTASAAKIAQEDAKYLGTKKPLGFSVLGIINRSGQDGGMKRYDKSFGMELQRNSVKKILEVFFNTPSEDKQIITKLVQHFSVLLSDVRQLFETQTRYHIYASSLLLVYDHQIFSNETARDSDDPKIGKHVRLRIIDFAHVFPANGTQDKNFIFGLDNLCKLFADFSAN